MARVKIFTDQDKKFITNLRLKSEKSNSKLSAKEAIAKLIERRVKIERTKNNKSKNWTNEEIEKYVRDEQISESAVQKFLYNLNGEALKNSVFNQPWHLGLMCQPDYAIPPEAIPHVIEIQKITVEMKRMQQSDENLPDIVTIRQAQWIAILHHIVTDRENLYYNSLFYVLYEQICNLAKTPFITSQMDMALPDSNRVEEALIELLTKGD